MSLAAALAHTRAVEVGCGVDKLILHHIFDHAAAVLAQRAQDLQNVNLASQVLQTMNILEELSMMANRVSQRNIIATIMQNLIMNK